MKRIIATLSILIPLLSLAQDVNLLKKDGSNQTIALNVVKSINFSAANCNMEIKGANKQVFGLNDIKKITFKNTECTVNVPENKINNTINQIKNYPNPFKDATVIELNLSSSQNVKISIYNVQGILVRNLYNRNMDKGNNQILWDGKNEAGSKSAEGLYIYQVSLNNAVITNKMFLIK